MAADIKHTSNKLNRLNKNVNKEYGVDTDEDSLESYMADLRNYKTVDKTEIEKLKVNLFLVNVKKCIIKILLI